jgi:hypothetical protein
MAWRYTEERETKAYSFWLGIVVGSLITAFLAQYFGIKWAGILGVGGGLFVLAVMKLKDQRRQRKEKERRLLR